MDCKFYNTTALRRAILLNKVRTVRKILLINPKLVKHPVPGDKKVFLSPLWKALLKRRGKIVKILLEFGADPNERCGVENKDYKTFLEFIAWRRPKHVLEDYKVEKILIQHGASLKIPLQIALSRGNLKFAEFLLQNGANLTGPEWEKESSAEVVLKTSDRSKRREMLQLLLKHGLDATFHDINGANLLHLLAKHVKDDNTGMAEVFKILLSAGVSLDDQDKRGYPPLHCAVDEGNEKLVLLLIKNGADVNLKDGGGAAPLHIAVHKNNENLVELLLSKGAKINADTNGWTALHQACALHLGPIISLLLYKGAEINSKNNQVNTPYHCLRHFYCKNFYDSNIVMIKEFSKLSFQNLPICKKDMDLIETGISYEIFNACIKELMRMASTKFYDCYSYYCIMEMHRNLKKLADLTKKEKFVKNFLHNLNKFPYYKYDLERILNEAIKFTNESQVIYYR